jgi:hypothetical protein
MSDNSNAMSDNSNEREFEKTPRRRWSLGVVLAAVIAIGAFIVASSSSAEPIYDVNKVVPNAAGMSADDASSSEDCNTEVFLAQDQDLWHFVVPSEKITTGTGSERITYTLTANITAVVIKWVDGGLERYTGTDDYDQGNAGPNLFWAYTEPGRTIEQAWLEYDVTRDDGETATETYLTTPHNLSHACAAEGNDEPPTISIASQADYNMVYDLVYDWDIVKSVDPAGLLASGTDPYVLNYSVDATRIEPAVPGNWRIVDGSMIINGTVDVTNATIDDIVITVPGGVCNVSEDATPGDDSYFYQCIITNEPTVTSASGLDGVNITVTGVVTTSAGTNSAFVILSWGLPDALILDDVIHATAYIVDGDRQTDASTGPLSLRYTVEWLPTICPDQRVNTAELFDGITEESLGIDDTVTVSGCPAVPGLTIGYWGNKAGSPQVVAAFSALRVQYPALAAIPITNEASVRNYFVKASCSGECITMFLAQALGTAMNARTGAFGDQSVYFDGTCRTVDAWLDLALRTAIPTSREARIAYKTLFDNLNNTTATRCASIG